MRGKSLHLAVGVTVGLIGGTIGRLLFAVLNSKKD